MHFQEGWMLGMGWLWILVVGIVIALVVWLAARATGSRPEQRSQPRREAPEEILQRRLATGEIDEEEYRRRMAALRSADDPRAG